MVVKARNKKLIEMPATSAELEDRFSEDDRAEQADDAFERFHEEMMKLARSMGLETRLKLEAEAELAKKNEE